MYHLANNLVAASCDHGQGYWLGSGECATLPTNWLLLAVIVAKGGGWALVSVSHRQHSGCGRVVLWLSVAIGLCWMCHLANSLVVAGFYDCPRVLAGFQWMVTVLRPDLEGGDICHQEWLICCSECANWLHYLPQMTCLDNPYDDNYICLNGILASFGAYFLADRLICHLECDIAIQAIII